MVSDVMRTSSVPRWCHSCHVCHLTPPHPPLLFTRPADNDLTMHRVHSNVSMDGLADAFSDASEEMFKMD